MLFRQLQLHLFIPPLWAESAPIGISRRCSESRAPISRSTSGIVRHITTVGDQMASRTEPPPFQNPYPYPIHSRPTPHEIFHLGPGATQDEIKKRYYELVRTHHPDSSYVRFFGHNQVEAHSRFRSIKAAYDFLRGHTLSPDPNASPPPSPQNFDPYLHELARKRRAYNASRDSDCFGKTHWAEGFGAPKPERGEWNENGTKERLILLCGVVALLGGLFPSLPTTLISMIFPTSVLPSSIFPFYSSTSSSRGVSSPPSQFPSNQSDAPPSTPSSSSIFSFFLDFDKRHRAAATALSEARRDARDMGVERREGVRKRVKDMANGTGAGKEDESTTTPER